MEKKKIVVEIPCQLSEKEIADKQIWLKFKVQDCLQVCHNCGKKLPYNETGYCDDCLYPNRCVVCGGKTTERDRVCHDCEKETVFTNESVLVLICKHCGCIMMKPFSENQLKFKEEKNTCVGSGGIYADVTYYQFTVKCDRCEASLVLEETLTQTNWGKPRIRCRDAVILVCPKLKRKPTKETESSHWMNLITYPIGEYSGDDSVLGADQVG